MYILGISGWENRGHDASACLLKNDKLIAFIEEERLIRKKHSYDVLPHNSIAFCLQKAEISVEDIDYLAISWNFPYHYKIRKMDWNFDKNKLINIIFPKDIFNYNKSPKIKFINHHLSHASSAFRCSGLKNALILVIDGQGEEFSTTLWHGNRNKIKFQKGWGINNSLGYFYEAASDFIGLGSSEPGKLMGLAAYGDPTYFGNFFRKTKKGYDSPLTKINLKYIDEEEIVNKKWKKFFNKKIGKENIKKFKFYNSLGSILKEPQFFNYKMRNLAASAQNTIEDIIMHLVRLGIKETCSKNLCIAGGVGLNCVLNGKILRHKLVDKIYVQPAAHDAGCSLGAAMELYSSLGYKSKTNLKHVYYGLEFSNETIKDFLKKYRLNFDYYDDISGISAELLAKDKLLGCFQGKMEFGPRALGNRSILANPSNPKMKNIINKKVKHREWFRPFAPTILDDKKKEYIENASYSPFMLFAFPIKKEKQKEVPSITHIDGTTRPQTLTKNLNPLFYSIIKNFESETSIPLLLNTSFNVRGEPIVCTPNDAIKTFYSSGLDYLIIGNYLVKKK